MKPHSLRAPSADGAWLAEPPLARANAMLADNADRLAGWKHDFQGRTADRLRRIVRRQIFDQVVDDGNLAEFNLPGAPAADRLVVTGHQPELFHPGVWVKNFAAAAVAKRAGGWGLNLVVDNDLPKSPSIRVPRAERGGLAVDRVAFDEWSGEVPYEDLKVGDETVFASFGDRVRTALGGAVRDPIIDEFWPRAVAAGERTNRLATRFSLARRGLEAAWGVHNLEVPLSRVCETEGFLWFACHLLAHLHRFQEIHNDALLRYRSVYGIRSRHHPVPALAQQGDWLEAPFWAWRAAEPRRRPLLVCQRGKTMLLRIAGEDESLAEIPLAADREACCAVEQLMSLPARRIRLRTRALTTTMFARFLVGDLFIHGIGGAKYDELGDEIAARFFGFESPAYLTVSMTLWLGLGDDPASPDRLTAVDRGLRDLTYNPDRHLAGPNARDPEVAHWVAAKRAAIAAPVATHAQRLDRFHEIRRCNAALAGRLADERQRLIAERERLAEGVRRNALAHNREYAFVLHSEHKLRDAMARAVAETSSVAD